jgi:hypothetical protein
METALFDAKGRLRAAPLRTCPEDALPDHLLGPALVAELAAETVARDVIVAAADSGLATNPGVLESLSAIAAKPLPFLTDYVEKSRAGRRELERVVGQLRKHFSLTSYMGSRSFGRNLGALRRHLRETEVTLIREAAARWVRLSRERRTTPRLALQKALETAPAAVVAFAMDAADPAVTVSPRHPVLVVYSTAGGRRFLRRVARELGGRASVVAAVAVPEAFATLRFRRRAYFLTLEPGDWPLVPAAVEAALRQDVAPPAKKVGPEAADWRAAPPPTPERRYAAFRGRTSSSREGGKGRGGSGRVGLGLGGTRAARR